MGIRATARLLEETTTQAERVEALERVNERLRRRIQTLEQQLADGERDWLAVMARAHRAENRLDDIRGAYMVFRSTMEAGES